MWFGSFEWISPDDDLPLLRLMPMLGGAVSFPEVIAAVRARWYLAVTMLLVTAVAGWFVAHEKPAYQATAVMVLVPPKEPTVPNTLASVTPSIAAAGLAVDDILVSGAEISGLRGSGVLDRYSVTPRNNGTSETPVYTVPSEQITVISANPDTAQQEAQSVVSAYTEELRSMQSAAGVRSSMQITDGMLAPVSVVELHGSKSRGLIAVGLLGVVAAIAVPVRLRPGRSEPGSRRLKPLNV